MALRDTLNAVVMDTETTGFRVVDGHRLLEIACVPIENGQVGEAWSSLVNPGRPVPLGATGVHGITDSMVVSALGPMSLAHHVLGRMGDRMLIFHNAPFDLPFVGQFFADACMPMPPNPVLDTLGLARARWGAGRGSKNSLTDCIGRLGLPNGESHRAAGDALMTAHLALALIDWFEAVNPSWTLAEVAAFSNDVVRRTSWGN